MTLTEERFFQAPPAGALQAPGSVACRSFPSKCPALQVDEHGPGRALGLLW